VDPSAVEALKRACMMRDILLAERLVFSCVSAMNDVAGWLDEAESRNPSLFEDGELQSVRESVEGIQKILDKKRFRAS